MNSAAFVALVVAGVILLFKFFPLFWDKSKEDAVKKSSGLGALFASDDYTDEDIYECPNCCEEKT